MGRRAPRELGDLRGTGLAGQLPPTIEDAVDPDGVEILEAAELDLGEGARLDPSRHLGTCGWSFLSQPGQAASDIKRVDLRPAADHLGVGADVPALETRLNEHLGGMGLGYVIVGEDALHQNVEHVGDLVELGWLVHVRGNDGETQDEVAKTQVG